MGAKSCLWVLVAALGLGWEVADRLFPQPEGALRPRTFRNRVECALERWGLIPLDPFRHIEG
ncbi:hypothetical protein J0H58_03040 [bacterium]|nr:hypothetical protein [bacterium]